MRISDWSSDVCSSDLEMPDPADPEHGQRHRQQRLHGDLLQRLAEELLPLTIDLQQQQPERRRRGGLEPEVLRNRSEEHTSELQSLMRISYAVLCLKKKKHRKKEPQYKLQHVLHSIQSYFYMRHE